MWLRLADWRDTDKLVRARAHAYAYIGVKVLSQLVGWQNSDEEDDEYDGLPSPIEQGLQC